MIRIDLSREQVAKKGDLKHQLIEKLGLGKDFKLGGQNVQIGAILLIIGSFLGAAVPYALLGIYKDLMTRRLRDQKAELQEKVQLATQEIQKLMPFQRELETFEVQKKQVRDRLDAIRALMKARGTPVNVLDAVGQSLPKKAWLTSVDANFDEIQGKVALQGQALTSEDVSDFVDRLSESLFLSDISLDDLGSSKIATLGDAKTFQITAKPRARASASETK